MVSIDVSGNSTVGSINIDQSCTFMTKEALEKKMKEWSFKRFFFNIVEIICKFFILLFIYKT